MKNIRLSARSKLNGARRSNRALKAVRGENVPAKWADFFINNYEKFCVPPNVDSHISFDEQIWGFPK